MTAASVSRRRRLQTPPFLGREDELAATMSCLERAAGGSFALMVIEGEAGIGKTRLVQEAGRRCRRLGMLVLQGAADDLDRRRPFAAVADALERAPVSARREHSEFARLLSDAGAGASRSSLPGPRDGGDLQEQVLDSVLGVLERLVLQSPVALLLEDLHWADVSTLLTIRAVTRRLAHLPICVLLTRRLLPEPAELTALLSALPADRDGPVRLGPLAAGAVADMVEAVAGGRPGQVLGSQLAGAHGNPLYVLELVRALMGDGSLTLAGGVLEVQEPRFPPSLRGALLSNLVYLSRPTLKVLTLASILGSQFQVAHLSVVSGLSVAQLLPSLEEALDAGILEAAPGERLAFRHEMLRQVIYGDLAPSLRSALHLEAGNALAAAGAPVLTVATQMVHGARRGDRQAVTWLRDAAEEALPRAPGVALELARHALSIAEPDDPCRGDLLVTLVNALLWTGSAREAVSVIRGALQADGIDEPVRESLRLPLTWALLCAGNPREARDTVEPALGGVRPPEETRQLMIAASFARLHTGDMKGAASAASAAVAAGEETGDQATLVPGLCVLSQVTRMSGRTREALDLAMRALAIREGGGMEVARWPCEHAVACGLMDADRFDDARAYLWQGMQRSRDRVGAWNLPLYQWKSAELAFLSGDWGDALAQAEANLDAAEEVGGSFRGSLPAFAWQAMVGLHRNDLRAAEAALRAGEEQFDRTGTELGADLLVTGRALLDEARGRSERALRGMERAWMLSTFHRRPLLGPHLVRMLMADRRRRTAQSRTEQVEEVAGTMAAPWARAAALRCRGLVEGIPEAVISAIDLLRESGRPLELAAACEEVGALLASRSRTDAIVALDEACARYDDLGAVRDAARVRARLRSLGVRRGRRGARRPRPVTGWESLTATEARIVGLVVDGLTSPQIAARLFVSRRTVETHVAHVFRKLDVHSRPELRASVPGMVGDRPAVPTVRMGFPAMR